MMEKVLFTDDISYSNILYIGDDAGDCLKIIEKFTGRLLKIENNYSGLFIKNNQNPMAYHWLQRHIQYHFEGGVAIFKFKNEEDLPAIVRSECITACRNLVFEQLFYAS